MGRTGNGANGGIVVTAGKRTVALTATQLVTLLITCMEDALGGAVPPLDKEKSVNIIHQKQDVLGEIPVNIYTVRR